MTKKKGGRNFSDLGDLVMDRIETLPETVAWTLKQAATFLGVPLHAVRVLVWRGELRYQQIGRRFMVPAEDVRKWQAGRWRRNVTA